MKYLLDTNVCIQHLNQRSEKITSKLISLSLDEICVCSVVKAELFYGAAKSHNPAKTRVSQELFLDQFVSFPFNDETALIYGTIRSNLEKTGKLIGPLDLMIAAIALANDLTLVTHNTAEFSRVDGLKFEDWEN